MPLNVRVPIRQQYSFETKIKTVIEDYLNNKKRAAWLLDCAYFERAKKETLTSTDPMHVFERLVRTEHEMGLRYHGASHVVDIYDFPSELAESQRQQWNAWVTARKFFDLALSPFSLSPLEMSSSLSAAPLYERDTISDRLGWCATHETVTAMSRGIGLLTPEDFCINSKLLWMCSWGFDEKGLENLKYFGVIRPGRLSRLLLGQ